jgi:hypothetical protein
VARNIVASVIVSGARQNMANYTVPFGLVTPVPGPFVCLHATMMDTINLHSMCEIVGQLKRQANAVARRINFFCETFLARHKFAERRKSSGANPMWLIIRAMESSFKTAYILYATCISRISVYFYNYSNMYVKLSLLYYGIRLHIFTPDMELRDKAIRH